MIEVASALKQAGVAFDRLPTPGDNLAAYRLLIIGENAVDGAVGQARDALRAAVSALVTAVTRGAHVSVVPR